MGKHHRARHRRPPATLRPTVVSLTLLLTANTVAAAPPMSHSSVSSELPVAPDNSSYEIGLLLGNQLEHNGLAAKLALEQLMRGLREGLAGHEQTAAERAAILHFMRDSQQSLAAANQVAAREFLTRNAAQSGVVSLPSGLQYRVLTPGDPAGKPPGRMDEVTIRYRATLADGHEFDSSDSHDRAAKFHLNNVLKGWQEALLAMHPGAKWQLFVPPELGYGGNTPPGVPPGSVLIYEIELLRVDPASAPSNQ